MVWASKSCKKRKTGKVAKMEEVVAFLAVFGIVNFFPLGLGIDGWGLLLAFP